MASLLGTPPAQAAVAAFLPGGGDHRSADAGCQIGGCAVPRRAHGAEDDGAVRPAAKEGDKEYRRADFDLTYTYLTDNSISYIHLRQYIKGEGC